MADTLQFDYDLLQSFIDNFKNCATTIENFNNGSLAPLVSVSGTEDPLVNHHMQHVRAAEESIYHDRSSVFNTAHEAAQATYDAFKDADQACGEPVAEQ